MNLPLISIITPAYNSGTKLLETVTSTGHESTGWEHLIIDGASTDGSTALAHSLAQQFSHVQVVSEPDSGVYDAMNKGVKLARGRYLLFLGAGDQLLPGKLTELSRHLPTHDHAMIYGDVLYKGARYDGRFSPLKLCGLNICHQGILYGREVFKSLGSYDTRYRVYADWEFNLRCFGSRQIEVRYVPVTVAVYEEGGLSIAGDPDFDRDRKPLIRRHLGHPTYFVYRLIRYKTRAVALLGLTNSRHRLIAGLKRLRQKAAAPRRRETRHSL